MRCEAKVRYGRYTLKGKSRYRAPKLDSFRPRYSSASRTKRFEILELQGWNMPNWGFSL